MLFQPEICSQESQTKKYFMVAQTFIIKKLIISSLKRWKLCFLFLTSQLTSFALRNLWFCCGGRGAGDTYTETHIFNGQVVQRSGTNKTLSRLFKALPGGGEVVFLGEGEWVGVLCPLCCPQENCQYASSGQMWNPMKLCNFLTHFVQKIVDGVTSESLTFFSLDT